MADNEDFINKTYYLKDIPKKRKYILNRLQMIYTGKNKRDLEKILDQIKIEFRKQKDRGSSTHKDKRVYITTREIDRYDINDEDDVKKYLNKPKSVITHEIIHIFQNIFKDFPHVDYTKGKNSIDYKKYVTDAGEIQARIEQIIDMLKQGFTKDEIKNFLYSKKYKDADLWKVLVDDAENILKKEN